MGRAPDVHSPLFPPDPCFLAACCEENHANKLAATCPKTAFTANCYRQSLLRIGDFEESSRQSSPLGQS